MQKAYLYVIKRALADGHRVAIWSCEGQEYETKRLTGRDPTAYTRLKDAIESQDWTNIRVWNTDDFDGGSRDLIATFAVLLEYGQDPAESICDWVVSEYADQVMADYETATRGAA